MSSMQHTDGLGAEESGERRENGENGESAGRGASGRNANPVYELFVLGELMMGSHYGYKLPMILQRILGPFHRLSWGTLYPLIRRLEQQGLITSESEPKATGRVVEQGQARKTKTYTLTAAGRTRFFALMLEPGDYSSDYPDLFAIKLSKFVLLTAAQQLLVLQQYREYLQILRDHYHNGTQQLLTNPAIGDDERPYLLQIADHHVYRCDAELTWLDKRIAGYEL